MPISLKEEALTQDSVVEKHRRAGRTRTIGQSAARGAPNSAETASWLGWTGFAGLSASSGVRNRVIIGGGPGVLGCQLLPVEVSRRLEDIEVKLG